MVALTVLFTFAGCTQNTKTDETSAENTSATDTTTAAPDTTAASETTAAPDTTEAVTEPPVEYDYSTIFKLDFASAADGEAPFKVSDNVSNLRIEGGLLKGTSTGGDPYIIYNGTDFSFPADSIQEIRINLKSYATGYDAQFFFTTDTISWSEDASYKLVLDYSGDDGDDNQVNAIVIDTTECAQWTGTVTGFRFDPSTSEGDFEIQSIEFLAKTVKQ